MCLALIALDAHPAYALVIAANRDEHHARPAAPAAWWNEGWIAGRDLLAGGTWLALTRVGRFALVTNVREPGLRDTSAPSRGALVTRVVADTAPPEESVARILASTAGYNGYNLVAGDLRSACWGSNRGDGGVHALGPGIHGLSNAALDAPWPKVVRSKAALDAWCRDGERDVESIFAALADRTQAADTELPATGVTLEWERRLSPPFIAAPEVGYGTRCSTVILIGRDGGARFVERTFDPAGNPVGDVDLHFALADLRQAQRA
jgi:uncharacterized protein with NRDE domain